MHVEAYKLTEISEDELSELSSCLIANVLSGASVGFLADIDSSEAESYWRSVCTNLGAHLHLWVVKIGGKIVGSIQLERSTKRNGYLRGEIQKLFVDPDFRRKGIASKLVNLAEEYAFSIGINTLVLDTESGSDAERLYTKLNWTKAGVIPRYALSPCGELKSTTYFYKERPARP